MLLEQIETKAADEEDDEMKITTLSSDDHMQDLVRAHQAPLIRERGGDSDGKGSPGGVPAEKPPPHPPRQGTSSHRLSYLSFSSCLLA